MNYRTNFSVPVLTAFAAAALLVLTPASSRAQDLGYGAPQNGNGQYADTDQQADPPARVGRLSVMQGDVSFQPTGVQDFSAAELNYPLTTGDRLYTDTGAKAEVEAGQLAIRLGSATDVTVTTITDEFAQFGLAQGSVHLRTYALDQNNGAEVDTPNASINILQAGDVRIDAYPQENITIVSVISGQAQVNADNVQQTLQAGQSIRISSMSADLTRRPRMDDLDSFSGQRDAFYQRAYSSEGSYVNPDTIGAADLSAYGDWDNSADDGAVWYPRSVAADWAPYSNGRWVSIAPWGWTWVGAEPWGFAPFHYGRWNRFGNRWGWIPGPRVVRPIYSPALVVFVGGAGFSIGGGGGVAAWFPLGPREVYRPWYRASTVYTNRVNVSNMYNRNAVEVRGIYNDRRDAYAGRGQASYVNRGATVAVPQRSFGSGRPVRDSAMRVDPRQFQNAPVMERPPMAAGGRAQGLRPAQNTAAPRTQRPVFETHGAPNAADPRQGGFNGRAPNSGGQPNGYQPGRGNGSYSAPGTAGQPAQPTTSTPAPGNGYGGRNNDGRSNNGRVPGQPAPAGQPVQPTTTTPAPTSNGYGGRNNDGRSNSGRSTQPGQPAPVNQPSQPPAAVPVQPAQGAQPVQPGRNANGYGRGNAAQPAPAAPVTQPAQPDRGTQGGYGGRNDGRFGRPAQAAPSAPAPVTQPAAPVQNDAARPGPQRQAPPAPVRVNPPFNRPEPQPAAPVQPRPVEQPRPQPVAPTQAPRAPQRELPGGRPIQAPPLHPQPVPAPKAEEKK